MQLQELKKSKALLNFVLREHANGNISVEVLLPDSPQNPKAGRSPKIYEYQGIKITAYSKPSSMDFMNLMLQGEKEKDFTTSSASNKKDLRLSKHYFTLTIPSEKTESFLRFIDGIEKKGVAYDSNGQTEYCEYIVKGLDLMFTKLFADKKTTFGFCFVVEKDGKLLTHQAFALNRADFLSKKNVLKQNKAFKDKALLQEMDYNGLKVIYLATSGKFHQWVEKEIQSGIREKNRQALEAKKNEDKHFFGTVSETKNNTNNKDKAA